MKYLILTVGVLTCLLSQLPAEEITLFTCKSAGLGKLQGHDVEKVTLGGELAKIDTSTKSFRAIIEQYREGSWKTEPFYGPVKKFIARDTAKKLYIVHFEYLKGHKALDPGTRFAVIELSKVNGHPGEFIGSPYDGSSVTEQPILDQLKRVADAIEEPKKKP